MKQLQLNPNEMALRRMYEPLIQTKLLTTVFRPQRRLCGDRRGYCQGQIVTLRIIANVGADWAGVPPRFMSGLRKRVVINKVEAKQLQQLTKRDFIGSSPDVYDRRTLRTQLGLIYNLPLSRLGPKAVVTRIQFVYLR